MTQRHKGNGGAPRYADTLTAPKKRPTLFPEQPQTLQQLLADGEDLARLMENPVFNKAWGWTIQAISEMWIESAPEEKQKREDLHRVVQLSKVLKQTLQNYVEKAKLEHQKLLQQEQLQRQAMEAGVPVEEL